MESTAVAPEIERFTQRPTKFQSPRGAKGERELQDKLYGLFLGMHSMGIENVRRAYLSHVEYEGGGDRLAVCVVADRATAEKTAGAIAKVFGNIYTEGRLDILFVNEAQEKQVQGSCKAFFSA